MNLYYMTRLILFSLASALLFLPTHAAEVPFPLPDPDGKPGDATKPVKVYILAGQSNNAVKVESKYGIKIHHLVKKGTS